MKFEKYLIPYELGDCEDYILFERVQDIQKRKDMGVLSYPSDFALANGALIWPSKGVRRWYINYEWKSSTYLQRDTYGEYRSDDDVKKTSCGVCPMMQVKFEALEDEVFGKVSIDPYEKTITFENISFPQTIAKPKSKFDYIAETSFLKESGRTYFARVEGCRECKGYIINGDEYVCITPDPADNDSIASDGVLLDKTPTWFKVEPIDFYILNWDNLPKEINPDGNGTDDHLELVSARTIIAGMPFSSTDEMGIMDEYHLYQNSMIRAYLNGYNLEKEIKMGNGNKTYYLDNDVQKYDSNFSGGGFLSQAFNGKITTAEKEMDEEEEDEVGQSPYNVKVIDEPTSVEEQIAFYIKTGKTFMLHGASGVGKSRRIKELDPNYVALTLRRGILPEEIIGKTAFENGQPVWIEPGWYKRICDICAAEPDHNHVLFIDEITNVRPVEQSLVYHLVLERSIDGNIGKLPKNCVVVAAGNNPYESDSAYVMPEPLFRRFEGHIYLKPDIKDFLIWGSGLRADGKQKIHPLVEAFVAAHGYNVFYQSFDSENPPEFTVDPRGWEQVSDIIYSGNGTVNLKLIADKVGPEIARRFAIFARNRLITVEDIVGDKYLPSEIPHNANSKFALVCSLRRANERDVAKVREFIQQQLGEDSLSLFDDLWASDSDENALIIDQLRQQQEAESQTE